MNSNARDFLSGLCRRVLSVSGDEYLFHCSLLYFFISVRLSYVRVLFWLTAQMNSASSFLAIM